MSVFNPETIKDVAESVGIASLNKDVVEHLARDVEYHVAQVIEESLKFMRHARRTNLSTQDITQALKVIDLEPLYGYDSTRPLRFGEASIGPGQPLFYVEDEEVDFEKLINAPLPKIPREISFTAHWLAVEGVQPSIPQNPTTNDSRQGDLLPKGPSTNNLAATSGFDSIAVKPLVKHIISKELQLYFDRIVSAILDEQNDEYRLAAFASLRTDNGLHQLVPYFVQFAAEKVTHSTKSLFVLMQTMRLIESLLENQSLYLDTYVANLVPSVLSCVIGKRLGNSNDRQSLRKQYELRAYASALLIRMARKYGHSSQTLKVRLAKTLLKCFLDPSKPFGAHYGAIVGLQGFIGAEGIKQIIMPHLPTYYDAILKEGLNDESKREEADMVVVALMGALRVIENDPLYRSDAKAGPQAREQLTAKVGEVLSNKVFETDRPSLVGAILKMDIPLI